MTSKRPYHERIFALSMALIIGGTAVIGGVLVVLQIRSDNKVANDNKAIQNIQEQLNNQNNQAKTPQEGKLEGSPLANFTPVAKIEKLEAIDTVPGTGDEVKAGATVTAHYTGAVAATGIVFQSSHDSGSPIPFGLNQVIKGWTDGVPGMKVGGTRRLLIPAEMAYGANPPAGSGIPANADLVFDIELTAVEQ